MNTFRKPATLLAICGAVALPLLAAEKLAAKIGLWETTTTTNVGGMTLPAEVLAGIPAAQRAQMEQMMKAQMGPRTSTERSCVTEKDLEEGAFRQEGPDQDMKCKFTVVTRTASKQESTFQCAAGDGMTADGRMVIEVVDSAHVKGSMQMKSPQMNIDAKFESKWVAASCGTTK